MSEAGLGHGGARQHTIATILRITPCHKLSDRGSRRAHATGGRVVALDSQFSAPRCAFLGLGAPAHNMSR
eukprot:scaffold141633_cov31-Tisochrysis_lutea.AAC.3